MSREKTLCHQPRRRREMATVHPSRMGLIPQEMRSKHAERRSPSPRRSRPSPSPRRSRSGDHDRRRQDGERRGRADSRERDRGYDQRRASPQYEDYKRPPAPAVGPGEGESSAPWRQQDSMYPGRRDHQHQGGGGLDFMERYARQ